MKQHRLFRIMILAILGFAACSAMVMAQEASPAAQAPGPSQVQEAPPAAQAPEPSQVQEAPQTEEPPQAGVPMTQGAQEAQEAQNPPGRVARLQYMDGQISIQPGGVEDWIAASMNRPLTSADRIWSDKESRAELTLGTAALRMNSETSLTLTNVGDRSVQLQLDQGVLSVTVFRLIGGEVYEIDTPNIAFTIMKPGEYRFDVLPDNDETWVTVRKGEGEATGQGRAVRVKSDEQVRFTDGTSMVHTAVAAPPRDGFEDWVKVRNKREEGSISARYVAPGVIGYEDLDTYGAWRVVPTYGPVWYPSDVVAGWAPYRYGHWVWISPWGWTWVDDAPWGFAPFHYGRWVWWGGAWGWCPGPVVVGIRPLYAPALVAWFGGPRFGVAVGFGGIGVGWFPLGWGEPFVPWYHYGPRYFRTVNITNTRITNLNVVNVNNIHYANRGVAGAITAAPASAFVSGRNMQRTAITVPSSMVQHGQVMRNAQVAPVHASVLGGHAPLAKGAPPARAFSRPVVTRQTPPARPPSFQSQQPLLAKTNGVPLNRNTLNGLRQPQNTNRPPASQPTFKGGTTGPAANVNPRTTPGGSTATNGRYVPRPPQASTGPAGSTGRNITPQSHTVPRPPERGTVNQGAQNPHAMANPSVVPRPPAGSSGTIQRGPNGPATTGPHAPAGPARNTAPTVRPGPYTQPHSTPRVSPQARPGPGAGGGRGAIQSRPAPSGAGHAASGSGQAGHSGGHKG
ncbi:MAG: DUF6600 domain-containing protein [Candidatus Korobacteraceae bacterium]|jgi:hypothetical protein